MAPFKRKFMKMLFAFFFALVMTASAFAQGSKNYVDATGALKSSLAVFSNVINSAAAPLTKGMVVCLDLTDDNGVSVDYCAGEGFKPLGVIVDASCAVGARCKMQTKGFFAFGKFDYLASPTVAGGMIYADVDGDIVVPATVTVADFPIGVCLDPVAADSSALEIYIDL
jgi:hypothetical protein